MYFGYDASATGPPILTSQGLAESGRHSDADQENSQTIGGVWFADAQG
jgi:hypothetical protein